MCSGIRPLRRWQVPFLPVLLLLLATRAVAPDSASRITNQQELGEKFSCEGRPSGFYADISSGCQMYHMCDEAGRVFTHTCPERTLFQQRTMVCDHWYMVECTGSQVSAQAGAATWTPPRAPPRQASLPTGAPPPPQGRKRHSQRVIAAFPYQRGNYTSSSSSSSSSGRDGGGGGSSSTITSPSQKLESFKISSIPSSTSRTPISSTATIERVTRPTFIPAPLAPDSSENRGTEFPIFQPSSPPAIGRATIERVFKDPFLSSPGDEVISQVQYIAPFREGKSGLGVYSTTPRPSTPAEPSLIESKYKQNPFFDSYFRTSFSISPPTPPKTVPTTQSPVRREEEESVENKLEIVIPDPRKMFYIPDSNYDPGDASKNEGTVLVIELPVRNTMKFQRVEVKEARNHDCPQCHPSFLLPGLCRPCVLIRR